MAPSCLLCGESTTLKCARLEATRLQLIVVTLPRGGEDSRGCSLRESGRLSLVFPARQNLGSTERLASICGAARVQLALVSSVFAVVRSSSLPSVRGAFQLDHARSRYPHPSLQHLSSHDLQALLRPTPRSHGALVRRRPHLRRKSGLVMSSLNILTSQLRYESRLSTSRAALLRRATASLWRGLHDRTWHQRRRSGTAFPVFLMFFPVTVALHCSGLCGRDSFFSVLRYPDVIGHICLGLTRTSKRLNYSARARRIVVPCMHVT